MSASRSPIPSLPTMDDLVAFSNRAGMSFAPEVCSIALVYNFWHFGGEIERIIIFCSAPLSHQQLPVVQSTNHSRLMLVGLKEAGVKTKHASTEWGFKCLSHTHMSSKADFLSQLYPCELRAHLRPNQPCMILGIDYYHTSLVTLARHIAWR